MFVLGVFFIAAFNLGTASVTTQGKALVTFELCLKKTNLVTIKAYYSFL